MMQNDIMKHSASRKVCVDHINHNGLDNRKSNLRIVTMQLNVARRRNSKTFFSKSGYRGVLYTPKNSKTSPYTVHLSGEHVGVFKTPEEAALGYNKAAKEKYRTH